ncbi:MAG: GxxExxY protein [Thermoguttaceae bacterium]|jgi:GxxExxY protein
MPVLLGAKIRRLDQKEFGEIAYEVMRCAFEVHRELGRCFDEKIYQREMAFRLADAQTEVPVEAVFETFRKVYYLDLVVDGGAIIELKAVEGLNSRHRGQLLNYLLLAEAAHGKIVNFRTERVQHEFVNATLIHADRIAFAIDDQRWRDMGTGGLKDRMIAVLRDWGTALDIALYEEVAAHFCGRAAEPLADIEIRVGPRSLGRQPVRLAKPNVALRVTSFGPDDSLAFESHLHRFGEHTALHAIQWINITPSRVQFTTIDTGKGGLKDGD